MRFPHITTKKIALTAAVVIALMLLGEDMLLTANARRPDQAILGLRLYDRNMSRQPKSAIARTIDQLAKRRRHLTFSYDGQTLEVPAQEVVASLDTDTIVGNIIAVGRRGSFWRRLLEQNKAFFGMEHQRIVAKIDQAQLPRALSKLSLLIYQEPAPAMPDFAGTITDTKPARPGHKLDVPAMTALIANYVFYPPKRPLAVPVTSIIASAHRKEEIDTIRMEALNLAHEPLTIISGGQKFTLTPAELLGMLTAVERPDTKNPRKTRLVLRVDDERLNRKLGVFAATVEGITHAEFDDHDARVAIYAQLYSHTRRPIEIPTGSNPHAQIMRYVPPSSRVRMSLLTAEASGLLPKTDPVTGEKIAYLTFDDGPNDIYHPMILDILKKYNLKATFFLVGRNSEQYAEVTTRTAAEEHTIGNHSLTHAFLPKQSGDVILQEIKTTKEILKSFNGGKDISLFRPPYGGVNPNVKKYSADLGLTLILWDVDPRDWSEPSTAELVNRVVSQVHPGADILLHSNHLVTVKALPQIIEQLKAKGYTFKLLGS